MDSVAPLPTTSCAHCGQTSPDRAARFCGSCGKELDAPPPVAPQQPEARRLLLAQAPQPEAVARLRACFDHLRRSQLQHDLLAGEILWPDESNSDLLQKLPSGVVPLADLLGPAGWLADHGWRVRLLEDLARALDALHARDCRLNSLNLSSILVRHQTLAFAGLCLPCCLTWTGTDTPEPLPGINGSFAAPEVQGFTEEPVGQAADVFLLAPLAHCLLTDRRPRDLMTCEFDPLSAEDRLGPALGELLTDTLSLRPACRPDSAVAFAQRLRRALLLDAGRDGFPLVHSTWSDVGLGGRPVNEDACAAWTMTETNSSGISRVAAFAVSDGIGGAALGERASAFCVAGLLDEMKAGTSLLGAALSVPAHAALACREWVGRLNQALLALSGKLSPTDDMGATLTALLFFGRRVFLLHAGDSVAHLVRAGKVCKTTRDQTYTQELVAQGKLSPEEAAASPHDNVLTSYVGTAACAPQVDVLEVQPGDCFVLCSDGLMEGLDEADVADVLGRTATERAAQTLVALALGKLATAQAGSPDPPASDNVTAVVVRILDPDPSSGRPSSERSSQP